MTGRCAFDDEMFGNAENEALIPLENINRRPLRVSGWLIATAIMEVIGRREVS